MTRQRFVHNKADAYLNYHNLFVNYENEEAYKSSAVYSKEKIVVLWIQKGRENLFDSWAQYKFIKKKWSKVFKLVLIY